MIAINYETRGITRNEIEQFNIADFGRIVSHRKGVKLFKKGFHSKMSYISSYSNLNMRSWNIFTPSIMEDFGETKTRFIQEGWLH